MQFRVIVVTDPPMHPPTNKQTGPITIHYAAASTQCNKFFQTCNRTSSVNMAANIRHFTTSSVLRRWNVNVMSRSLLRNPNPLQDDPKRHNWASVKENKKYNKHEQMYTVSPKKDPEYVFVQRATGYCKQITWTQSQRLYMTCSAWLAFSNTPYFVIFIYKKCWI